MSIEYVQETVSVEVLKLLGKANVDGLITVYCVPKTQLSGSNMAKNWLNTVPENILAAEHFLFLMLWYIRYYFKVQTRMTDA